MKGQAIPRVKAHNYLGLKVTSTLSWSEHISCTRAKCAQRVGMIRKILHRLLNHVLKRIYEAQVRSILEYGCAVWSGDNISMLQKLQDRFCREKWWRSGQSVSGGAVANRFTASDLVGAQWPIGYGVGLRIKRSSVRIRPWPLR